MATPSAFTLPETHRAFEHWAALTGLGWDSPEWGEVWQALQDCNLLSADRLPERALFDLPDVQLGDTRRVVHLRTAIVAGAMLHGDGIVADPATGTEVVAALLDCLYGLLGRLSYNDLVVHLARDLPTRRLAIHESPSGALSGLYHVSPRNELRGLAVVIVRQAMHDDRFAEDVFTRLSTDPDWAIALVRLGSSGRWLTFRPD